MRFPVTAPHFPLFSHQQPATATSSGSATFQSAAAFPAAGRAGEICLRGAEEELGQTQRKQAAVTLSVNQGKHSYLHSLHTAHLRLLYRPVLLIPETFGLLMLRFS